jgi:hypothetical protein
MPLGIKGMGWCYSNLSAKSIANEREAGGDDDAGGDAKPFTYR